MEKDAVRRSEPRPDPTLGIGGANGSNGIDSGRSIHLPRKLLVCGFPKEIAS